MLLFSKFKNNSNENSIYPNTSTKTDETWMKTVMQHQVFMLLKPFSLSVCSIPNSKSPHSMKFIK